jgi:CBS domain containing-hemolysin-like protein
VSGSTVVPHGDKSYRSLRGNLEAPVTSTEEIRLLATLGRSEGAVGARTAGMIVGATQLRHLHADDVMLPREEVRFLSAQMDRDEAMKYVRETGHSRFPFSPTGELKDVSGVVLAKELLYWLLNNEDREIDWTSVCKEALLVPRSLLLPQLLRTFQESRRHLAIIIDEYGSVEGIATLEDVLEEIVGEIHDESDMPVEDFRENDEGQLIVRANVDLRKLSSRLGIAWEPDTDAATIGGLVTESLERIPRAGDSISWNGYRIEVLRADRRRPILLSIQQE